MEQNLQRFKTIPSSLGISECTVGKYLSIFIAAKVKIYTAGFDGKIAIKAVKMQKYLAMDKTGKVYLAVSGVRGLILPENCI
jgi:hypothetical protein